MSVQVEKLEKNMAKLTIEVSAEDFEAALEKAYQKNKGKIALPGFRKGKAPRKMIEKMYGVGVFYEDAANGIIPEAYAKAADECGEDIVSQPDINVTQIEKGKPFIFTAEVALKPAVTLGEYKGVEVEKTEVAVSEEEVDKEVDRERESNARELDIDDRAVENGDKIKLNFEGFVDGVPFEGGKGEDYPLTIGSGSFIPGFEDQLKGHKAGDDVTVKVTFPANYFVKDLAGKEAEFAVHVNDVKQKVLPEINDEFAKSISKQDSLKDLMETMKAEMQGRATFQANQAYRQALVDLAVANAQVDIPQEMIDQRLDDMIDEIRQNIEAQGHSFEQYLKQIDKTEEDLRKDYTETAEKNVREGLVLNAIADKEDIHATDQDLSMEVFTMAQQFNADPNEVVKIIREQNRVGMLIDSVTRKKEANFLAKQAKKEEKPAAEKEEKAEAEKE